MLKNIQDKICFYAEESIFYRKQKGSSPCIVKGVDYHPDFPEKKLFHVENIRNGQILSVMDWQLFETKEEAEIFHRKWMEEKKKKAMEKISSIKDLLLFSLGMIFVEGEHISEYERSQYALLKASQMGYISMEDVQKRLKTI